MVPEVLGLGTGVTRMEPGVGEWDKSGTIASCPFPQGGGALRFSLGSNLLEPKCPTLLEPAEAQEYRGRIQKSTY